MFNSEDLLSQYSYTDSSSDENLFTDLSFNNSFSSSELNKKEVKIPKIIMQTWKDKNIPDKWKCSPESIKKHMPDWKYVLMTDKDNREFVKKHFPDFLPYYDAFPYPIMRADAIRYMWLYINGGLYLDLDFEVLKPLDGLFTIDAEAYLVNSSNVGSYLTNSFMASKPRCKLWLEVIEAMKKELPFYCVGKHLVVMNQSGPVLFTHTVRNSGVVYGALPVKYILPCSICNIKCKPQKGAYVRQLEGSSWNGFDTKFFNFFMCNYRELIIAIVLILLVLLISFILGCCGIV